MTNINSSNVNSNSSNSSSTTKETMTYHIDFAKFNENLKHASQYAKQIANFHKSENPLSILRNKKIEDALSYSDFLNTENAKGTSTNKIMCWLLSQNMNLSMSDVLRKEYINDTYVSMHQAFPGLQKWSNETFEVAFHVAAKDLATRTGFTINEASNALYLKFGKEVLNWENVGCKNSILASELELPVLNDNPFVFITAEEVLELASDLGFMVDSSTVFIGNSEFTVSATSIIDSRNRKLMSGLMMQNKCVHWVPAHTLFILALCKGKENHSKFENKIAQTLMSDFIWDSESEIGVMNSGVRSFYTYFVCDRYNFELAFNDGVVLFDLTKASVETAVDFDKQAFLVWNLLPMHKGKCPYFWATMAVIRCYKMEKTLLDAVIASNHANILSGLSHYSSEEAIEQFKKEGLLIESTKQAKASKRVGLPLATSAEIVDEFCEESAFVHSTQDVELFGRDRGFTNQTIFADNALGNPGAAIFVDNVKRQFLVNHKRSTKTVGLTGIECKFEHSTEISEVNKTVKYVFTPTSKISFNENDVLVSYETSIDDNVEIPCEEPGELINVSLHINSFGESTVVVAYKTLESEVKLRGIVKALTMRCKINPVLHPLNNPSLVEGTELLILADSNKSSDLLQNTVSVMAQTMAATEEGRKIIATLNSAVNVNEDTYLVFDAVMASFGLYDEAMKAFNAAHRKAVWLQYEGNEEFDALCDLYTTGSLSKEGKRKKWFSPSLKVMGEIKGLFSENVTQILIDGDISNPETEILVWTKTPESTKFYQRTFALVNVLLHTKPELCSVSQAVSTTSTLTSIAHAIELDGDHQTASDILSDDFNMRRWSAAQAMHVSKEITEIKVASGENLDTKKIITIFDESNKQTPEFVKLASSYANQTLSIDELTKAFPFYAFRIKAISPFILEFQGLKLISSGDDSSKTLILGCVKELFRKLFTSCEFATVASEASSIINDMLSMLNSVKTGKHALHGCSAVSSKIVANYGVNVEELLIKKSSHPKSLFAVTTKLYGDNWNGRKVAFTRSPVPFVAVLRLVLVDETHPMFACLGEFTGAVNGLANAPSGGDFDGDNYSFFLLREDTPLEFLTAETALKLYSDRTGLAWNAPLQDSYFADHWTAKGYKKFNSLVSEKNFALYNDCKDNQKGFLNMSIAASRMQLIFVGVAHKLAFVGSTMSSLAIALESTDSSLEMFKDKSVPLCLYEVYEAGLGGLNWNLFNAYKWILGATTTLPFKEMDKFTRECYDVCKQNDAAWFAQEISKGGCNAKYAPVFIDVAKSIFDSSKAINNKLAREGIISNNETSFVKGIAFMFFCATKNDLRYNIKFIDDVNTIFGTPYEVVHANLNVITNFKFSESAHVMMDNSVVLSQFGAWAFFKSMSNSIVNTIYA